jgi:alkyl hydroperoxide reductase subunit D
MTIEELKNQLPDYAKDIKLNLSTILTEEGTADLTQKQIYQIALGVAFAIQNTQISHAIISDAGQTLSAVDVQAAKAAATIMAMNNIYYRAVHLATDKSFATMPAKLRMTVIGNSGIDKKDFEMICLAISAVNGCGACIDAHINELVKTGVSKVAVQSSLRIASVLNAFATGLALASI